MTSPKPSTTVIFQLLPDDDLCDSDSSEIYIDHSDKCCVCKKYTTIQLKYCIKPTLCQWGHYD